MAKPIELPKYLLGKNPKPLIEVFEAKMMKSISFECPVCGIQMWDYAGQEERLQQMEDEHTDTCGNEGSIDASEVED